MHLAAGTQPDGPAPRLAPASDPREAVVRRHLRGVWRYLRMLGCPPDLADDLTQESFAVALSKGATDRDPPATAVFLRQTARFLYLRTLSRNREVETVADAADLLWQRDCDDGDGLIEAVRRCVHELPERSRRAVQLAYGEGHGRAEIARRLDLKENGVKTLLQRARQALRECVRRRMA